MHISPILLYRLKESLTQHYLHQERSPFLLGIFDVFTKSFFRCLLFRTQSHPSPAMTSACLYTALSKLGNATCANSPLVNNALALSTEMKSPGLPQVCPRCFQGTSTPRWLPFIMFVTSFKALIMLSLSLQLLLCSVCSHLFSHGKRTPPPQEVFHWEQLAVLVHVSERDCSFSSFSPSTCLRKLVLFHRTLL